MTAIVFPGQGSQSIGMVRELFEQFPSTRRYFEEASDAVGLDLAKLCLDGPEDLLKLTKNAQPAILTTSLAWFYLLQGEKGLAPRAAAGHSLGEYSALVAAGSIGLFDAVRLVRARGELMQNAVPEGVGKMAAVLGLDEPQIQLLCEQASKGAESLVTPANYNSPGQIVVAGHAAAVDRLEAIASEKDSPLKARKVIPLKVSAPFHCPLMTPVAEAFKFHLAKVQWKSPAFPVLSNVDGEPHELSRIASSLQSQIDHPVRWTRCVEKIGDLGISTYLEPGPGRVLSGLIKRCREGISTISVDNFEEFKKFGGSK